MKKKLLPVGIENFSELCRFGKSLNMSMLKAFFEVGCDRSWFDGLRILQEQELCDAYMGQFPVVSITWKSVDGWNFQSAYDALRMVIGTEAMRLQFLEASTQLNENEKAMYRTLTREISDTGAAAQGRPAWLSNYPVLWYCILQKRLPGKKAAK